MKPPGLNLKDTKRQYKFESKLSAKIFWQYAVSLHAFFRVHEPNAKSELSNYKNPASISATSIYTAMSRVASGFKRYFSTKHQKYNLHNNTCMSVGGVDRTMSTINELRKSSRFSEKGFSRYYFEYYLFICNIQGIHLCCYTDYIYI